MMKTVKFLVAVLGLLLAATSVSAQQSSLVGIWVLDSVQVKEIWQDSIVEKTVLPNEQALFNENWITRFKLDTNGKVSYTEVGHSWLSDEQSYAITDVPYYIRNIADESAVLIIEGVAVLNIQFLSGSIILIHQPFMTGSKPSSLGIEGFWKMYYSYQQLITTSIDKIENDISDYIFRYFLLSGIECKNPPKGTPFIQKTYKDGILMSASKCFIRR